MGVYTEKEVLGDALASQKCSTNNFNTFSNECVHEDLRQTLLKILSEEHDIQQDVFKIMHSKGYYPTPDAEQQKVDQLKQQYAKCASGNC